MPLNDEAREAFVMATQHWEEVLKLDPAATPRAAAHTAYYAMYHGARSILLAEFGTASTRHGAVSSAFAKFAQNESEEVARLAEQLRAAYDMRTRSDYTGEEVLPEEAADIIARAKGLLAYCVRRLGVEPPTGTP